jgi:hypothetical protein
MSPKVSGYQGAKSAGGRVADEIKVADLLCDDVPTWAGAESLYLWAKDLAKAISFRSRGDLSAMAAKTQAGLAAAAAGRDSVSATTFDVPGTYTSWFVYSKMNAR